MVCIVMLFVSGSVPFQMTENENAIDQLLKQVATLRCVCVCV